MSTLHTRTYSTRRTLHAKYFSGSWTVVAGGACVSRE